MRKITVLQFIENRPAKTFGKKIFILDHNTHKGLGKWYDNDNPYKAIRDMKMNSKYLFIYV